MVYVRQEQLPGLKQYKYSAVDRSPISKYILKPFYNNVVINMFPLSMAYVTACSRYCYYVVLT